MVNLQNQKEVELKVKELVTKGNKLFHADLKYVKIEYSTTMAPHGLATYDNGWYTLTIHENITKENMDEVLNDIIPHEVAHLICFWIGMNGGPKDYKHGNLWKRIDLALGGTGNIKSTIAVKTSRKPHHYISSNGENVFLPTKTHNLIQQQYRVYRTKSGGRITASDYQTV